MKLSNQEILADILIDARITKGYSQRQLANITGISNTEISKLEKAERLKPKPQFLKMLSEALDLDYEEVLEAIGYLETDDFENNTFMLSSDEKDFIVESVLENYKNLNPKFENKYDNKENVYRLIFNSKNENIMDPNLKAIINEIVDLSSDKDYKNFISLCRWYLNSLN